MLRWIKIAIVFNVIVSVLFIYGSYVQWNLFTGNNEASATIFSCAWSPTKLTVMFYVNENGVIDAIRGLFVYPNTPFMLFWVSTIGNLSYYSHKKTMMVTIHQNWRIRPDN
jgi:hypothetical protein